MNEQQQGQYQPFQRYMVNPFFDPYGALHNYTGQNPYQSQNQPQQPQPPTKADFIYRPVSNIEEAKAAQIDWDGTVYFFEDKASGQIYRKQYVNDLVSFTAFGIFEIPEPPKPDYVTNDTLTALLARIGELEKRIPLPEDDKRGGFKK